MSGGSRDKSVSVNRGRARARAPCPEPRPPPRRSRRFLPALTAIGLALACFGVGIFIGYRKSAPAQTLALRHARVPAREEAAPEPAAPGENAIVFAGGLTCEGLGYLVPAGQWRVNCLSQNLSVQSGSALRALVPRDVATANPPAFTVALPGWIPMEVRLPGRDLAGDWPLDAPVNLVRETGRLAVMMPPTGTDYDSLLVEWLRPLDDEPLATPPRQPLSLPLTFKHLKATEPLPTGIYRLTLQSWTPDRIRDFVLVASLPVRAMAGADAPPAFPLPPSISRSYAGLADVAPDPRDGEYPIGFFCGLRVDVRKTTGQAVLAFESLRHEQTVRFSTLRPRPDTVWPVSNLYLSDPAHLTFDCPLSHADHRITLDIIDGRATVLPETMIPDDRERMGEMLERMRNLIRIQARESLRHPQWFDARYLNLPVQQLPNYENLLSLDKYARHLARITQSPLKRIEVGTQLTVRHQARGGWTAVAQPFSVAAGE